MYRMWILSNALDTRKRGAFLTNNKNNTTMEIDKTFHNSDPYDVTCDNCKFSVYDIEIGLFCKLHNEPIQAYWKCDYANSIRN